MSQLSIAFYRALPDNYNCAQAVLKGFQQEYGISDNVVAEFRVHGGGRAAGGMCGALFAANYLRSLRGLAPITETFRSKLGFTTCKELKLCGKVSCKECIGTADELLRE